MLPADVVEHEHLRSQPAWTAPSGTICRYSILKRVPCFHSAPAAASRAYPVVPAAESCTPAERTITLTGIVCASPPHAGAQDVSNALGTSVGSKALTVKQAILVGAVCEFAGSLVGGEVAATISGGILELDSFKVRAAIVSNKQGH